MKQLKQPVTVRRVRLEQLVVVLWAAWAAVLGQFRPEMFSGIGALPKPAVESHIVNRGTPVAPCRLKAQRKRVTDPRGKPLQSRFPKYHELFEEPHHCKAADAMSDSHQSGLTNGGTH